MRIEADLDVCIGAGMCAMTAPTVFDQDPGDGRVRLLAERIQQDDEEAARDAVALCPSGALSLRGEPAGEAPRGAATRPAFRRSASEFDT